MHNIKNKNRFLIKSSSTKPSESRIFRNNLSSYLPKNDPKRESSIVRDSLPLTNLQTLQTLQFSFLFFSYDRIFAPSLSRNCSGENHPVSDRRSDRKSLDKSLAEWFQFLITDFLVHVRTFR